MQPNARRFENWESNCAALYGLGLAIDYAMSIGMERISDRLRSLARLLRDELSKIEGVTVMDIGKRKGGIVSFKMEKHTPKEIKTYLASKNINVSIISPQGALLDSVQRNLHDGMVRASVHYYNTKEEIGILCTALKKL
jgi:selenocysteine lyase/cysteine desulfurase